MAMRRKKAKRIQKPQSEEQPETSLDDFLKEQELEPSDFKALPPKEQLEWVRGFCFFLHGYIETKDVAEEITFKSLEEYSKLIIKLGMHSQQEDLISQFRSLGD
jgi:hypothetical protein